MEFESVCRGRSHPFERTKSATSFPRPACPNISSRHRRPYYIFALRDQPVIILLLIFLRERTCLSDNARLGFRNDHVVLTEGNTGLERPHESRAP